MERQHTEPGSDPKSTNLLTKYQSASANLSSQVTPFACRQTNLQNNLFQASMNPRSGHLFDQEHQERHISIKFHSTFYNLARRLSMSVGKKAGGK